MENSSQSARDRKELQNAFRRLTTSIEIADVIGILMVVTAGLSAYTALMTRHLAEQLLMVTARPYVGTHGVSFDRIDSTEPRVVADIRNFGSVQAGETVIKGHLLFEGKEISGHRGPRTTVYAGVMSPGVPHPIFFHLPAMIYRSATDGHGDLRLHLEIRYTGPSGDAHCYDKNFAYDADDSQFYSDKGTIECK